MSLHLIATSEILNEFIASILAAVFIAVVAWVYSWSRNLLLERALEEAIDPNGIGTEFNLNPLHATFTLQIHNYANAYIRVRTVIFIAEKFHIELEPDSKLGLFQTPLSNEAIREKFDRKHLSGASLGLDNNPHSFLLHQKQWQFGASTLKPLGNTNGLLKMFSLFLNTPLYLAMLR